MEGWGLKALVGVVVTSRPDSTTVADGGSGVFMVVDSVLVDVVVVDGVVDVNSVCGLKEAGVVDEIVDEIVLFRLFKLRILFKCDNLIVVYVRLRIEGF